MAKTESVIYSPPNKRLPFLVVTVAPEGISALQVNSHVEARKIVTRQIRRKLTPDKPRPS